MSHNGHGIRGQIQFPRNLINFGERLQLFN